MEDVWYVYIILIKIGMLRYVIIVWYFDVDERVWVKVKYLIGEKGVRVEFNKFLDLVGKDVF